MAGDDTARSGEAIADAEAIDEALAAYEDACAQLAQSADKAVDHPGGRPSRRSTIPAAGSTSTRCVNGWKP